MRLRFVVLLALVLLACAPAPQIVTGPPIGSSTPVVAVAAPTQARVPDEADEPIVEDSDPGPVPVNASDPWWGRRDAPVTIVEFGDFQCPFTARVENSLAELRLRYGPKKLRVVWKNNPLPFHNHAKPAAVVAMALFERFGNEGFWKAHHAFFADQRHLDDIVTDGAERAGLSPDDLDALAKGRAGQRIDADVDLAKRSGITGTPAFLINGVHLSGAQSVDKFAELIDAQLAKAAELVARGTAKRRVYAELTKAQWSPKPASTPSKPDDGVYNAVVGGSPVRGKPTALVTIVEFGDFQCPFSGRVAVTMQQLLAKYGDKLRLVWKDNPLTFHRRAEPAAELALEARAQRGDAGFWKAHDLLFGRECAGFPSAKDRGECDAAGGRWLDNQQHLDDTDLLAYAKTLGLDVNRVQGAINAKKHAAAIDVDQDLADDLQANSTPHLFINGRRLTGAQPFEKFVAVIDEELAKAQAMVKGGVGPAKVYEKIMAGATSGKPVEKKTVAAPTRANPSRGPANAKVVVQFFGDFQCPFSARARTTLDELVKAFPGKVRVVWRNHPLSMHPNARPAAMAAMEAFQQKGDPGFWAMFEVLYAAPRGGLDRPALEGYAAQLGLDPKRFADALDTQAHATVIDADTKTATGAGILGTPAYVINGYHVSGAQPLRKLKRVVSMALSGK